MGLPWPRPVPFSEQIFRFTSRGGHPLNCGMTPEYCPNCGEEVPEGARACPGCGSDETTGWSDEAGASRLGIPDDSFDYDEFVKQEFGEGKPSRPMNWLWVAVAVILALVFLSLFL